MPRLSLGDHCTHRGEIARVIGVRGARRLITFGHDDVDAVWVPIEELRPQGSVGLSPETLALLARVPHVVRDRAETIASCIERIRESVTSGRRGPALRQQLHVQGIEVSERQL